MSQKCKILHLQLLPLLSGVQNMMLSLLVELDPEKYEITVASKPNGPLVNRVQELGFTYIPIKNLRRRFCVLDIFAFIELYKTFKKNNYDIVHTHSSKTGFLGRIAAKLAGVKKVVHTVHGFSFNDTVPFPINQMYQLSERIAACFTDKLVFVNSSEKKLAIRKKIAKKTICSTIHNGVDIYKNISKRNYKGFEDKLVIGYVGRFAFQKNIINLIKAAGYAVRKNHNLGFIFVGDGPDWEKCNSYIEANNFTENIKLVGWQNDIKMWLSYFDALVLFSRFEGLPISILEAMAAGLPIIASDIKGNNELVDDSNGVLIDLNRIDLLIAEFINIEKSGLLEKGKNSLEKIETKFNKRTFVEKYIEVYEC